MNYEELVKALRDIEKTMFALGTSSIKMDNVSIRLAYDKKWGRTAKEAAAAIEALQAQLPKLGEWKTTRPDAPMFGFYYCSICGRKRTSPQDNYCPNCGAKMTEVQDGK